MNTFTDNQRIVTKIKPSNTKDDLNNELPKVFQDIFQNVLYRLTLIYKSFYYCNKQKPHHNLDCIKSIPPSTYLRREAVVLLMEKHLSPRINQEQYAKSYISHKPIIFLLDIKHCK